MNQDTIKTIQIKLTKYGKINKPIVTKLDEYLKIQEEIYHEIQLIPNHLLSEDVLKILDENNVSLYRIVKSGNHYKHLLEKNNDKATYIFIIKKGKSNNILLSSNHHFSVY